MTKTFAERLLKISEERSSHVILALDLEMQMGTDREKWHLKKSELFEKSQSIFAEVASEIVAVKLNNHLLLPLGLYGDLQPLIENVRSAGLPIIYDAKVGDIGSTNRAISRHLFDAGVDAVICNPFVGWEEGLEPIFYEARSRSCLCGVILLVFMSHPGAFFGFGALTTTKDGTQVPFYHLFAKMARERKADGVIVGATALAEICSVRSIVGSEVLVISPGVGAQGGDAIAAIKAGSDFVIVGRSITSSSEPAKTVRNLREEIEKSLGS